MSKKKKHKRFQTPAFLNKTQRDCFHFILEEEELEVKKAYKIADKTYKEVEWTFNETDGTFVVYLNAANEPPEIVSFPLETFPLLLSFWKHLKMPPEQNA